MSEPLPATMRAVLLTGIGGPERLELRDDVPVPLPGLGEVLVKVAAAGVNNTDINTRVGWYSKAVAEATAAGSDGFDEAGDDGWSGSAFTFPRIQGADCCGRIVAVGANGDASRIGERVLVDPLIREADGSVRYFGSELDGSFAEFTCVPARNALRVECALSDAELASFPCAYSTAENILTRIGLARGERVLITGASGGVGSAAVQLAKRRMAEVIAVSSADKAEAVRAMGADHIALRGTPLDGFGQVDAVVDVVGGAAFTGLLDALRSGGRYGVSGAIAGPMVSLDLRTLYLKDLRLIGCTVLEPEVFPNLIGYIERGEIRPVVDAIFPIAEIAAAQQLFGLKRHVGKIVLQI
jgi:NADPH:quinone reductase-like Zn-dependent oxidoreductase